MECESNVESIDNNMNNCNSNSNTSNTTEDKTYHFRKGSDLDGFESFGELFANGLFTDLAICCSGRIFRCHRVIMAASSLYMKNALSAFNNSNNNNINNNCNTIMIMPEDIKVCDMEAILHFIYNGEVEVTRDAIESFLTSAKTLNIKGLANIKLVYNNQNDNKNQFNHNINNNNNNHNNNDNNIKRKNGMIATNRSQLKNDLNFSGFNSIPQTQSFHSSQEIDLNNSQSNRRKQRFPSNTPINGFTNDSQMDSTNEWITINSDEDEEEDNEDNEDNGICDKVIEKMEEKEERCELSHESVPQMPCLIQIDADPTTFPSYCPETNDNGIKRRRSSSLKSLTDVKTHKSVNSSVKTNRNNEQIRKPVKMVRSSNRKLGFIFHKSSSTSIWNSNNKWKCDTCNKLYGNKQTLKEHIDYFHSNRAEQIFTCNICSKEYTWKKSLMKHYRDIHQINNNSLMEINKQTESMVTSVNSSQNK